jgi:hypothetical protein
LRFALETTVRLILRAAAAAFGVAEGIWTWGLGRILVDNRYDPQPGLLSLEVRD